MDTKVIEGVEGTRTVDNTDPSLSRPLRISFSEGVYRMIFKYIHTDLNISVWANNQNCTGIYRNWTF